MRHLTADDFIETRWKNGAGAVTQLAIHPPEATLETFTWRVSMAAVTANGPFSLFAGIERSLAIVSGEGLALHMGGVTHRVVNGGAPLRFAADTPVEATLLGGPVTDLNVMTRRAEADHSLAAVEKDAVIAAGQNAVTLIVASSPLCLHCDGHDLALAARELLWLDAGETARIIVGEGFAVRITPA